MVTSWHGPSKNGYFRSRSILVMVTPCHGVMVTSRYDHFLSLSLLVLVTFRFGPFYLFIGSLLVTLTCRYGHFWLWSHVDMVTSGHCHMCCWSHHFWSWSHVDMVTSRHGSFSHGHCESLLERVISWQGHFFSTFDLIYIMSTVRV